MREFDTNGLRLAEFQGKIFEASCDYFECSTNVFLRRFLHSDLLKILDKNESYLISYDVYESLDSIEKQFGKTNYGKIKRSKESLFWVGYFYRYMSYTRETSTRFLMKTFDYNKLFELYYVYHTQDMEWCVSSLLELYNLDENFFDKNYRLKEFIRNKTYSSNLNG